jgi:hypothetical protein
MSFMLYHEFRDKDLGRPFEAFTHGTFTDMRGRKIEVTKEQLKTLVENTRNYLASLVNSQGEPVGLPIDCSNHDHGDAAGWIVGVELVNDVVQLIPKWTELGIEKLTKGIVKLFSASIDLEKMVIVGGSLTNWPAVKGLKPVELSGISGLFEMHMFEDEPYRDYVSRVAQSFHEQMMKGKDADKPMECYVRDVYDGYVVVDKRGKMMKVEFTEGENGSLEFAGEDDWKPVRMVPLEMASKWFSDLNQWLEERFPKKTQPLVELEEIDMTADELKALLDERDARLLAALKPEPKQEQEKQVREEISTLADLEGLRTQLHAEMETAMRQELDRTREMAGRMFNSTLAELHETRRVADFSQSLTDGKIGAMGLPMQSDRVEKFLLSLNTNQRKEAEGLFAEIVKTGLIDFSEMGHGKESKQKPALPEPIAEKLRTGELTLAELSSPLGKQVIGPLLEGKKLEDYDLAPYAAK